MYREKVNRYNIVEVKAMNDTLLKQIGGRIRNSRESIDYTREMFAEKAGISPQFLAEIENGKKGMSADTIYSLCEAFSLSADYILFGRISIENDLAPINKDFNALSKENYSLLEEIIKVMLKTQNNK